VSAEEAQFCSSAVGSRRDPDADPFRGRGPHPLAVDIRANVLVPLPFHLPADSPPPRLQLIVCDDDKGAQRGDQVGTCPDAFGNNIPLYSSTYPLSVYEAMTGRLVKTVTITGDYADCEDLFYREGGLTEGVYPTLAMLVSVDQYDKAFHDLVYGNAP
jgi:hypothetical protein